MCEGAHHCCTNIPRRVLLQELTQQVHTLPAGDLRFQLGDALYDLDADTFARILKNPPRKGVEALHKVDGLGTQISQSSPGGDSNLLFVVFIFNQGVQDLDALGSHDLQAQLGPGSDNGCLDNFVWLLCDPLSQDAKTLGVAKCLGPKLSQCTDRCDLYSDLWVLGHSLEQGAQTIYLFHGLKTQGAHAPESCAADARCVVLDASKQNLCTFRSNHLDAQFSQNVDCRFPDMFVGVLCGSRAQQTAATSVYDSLAS
mmetsp:Transcript_56906/g.124459  ORF Transcript_56906/g.124459 Transcript_56906/m.124459 type:complete len:256 (-) Transcript_56906:741-1508(-)